MSISGALSNRLIAKEPISDFLARDMSTSMAVKKNNPLSHVALGLSGLTISVSNRENLLLHNPAKVLEENRGADCTFEVDYIARVDETKNFIQTLKSGMQGKSDPLSRAGTGNLFGNIPSPLNQPPGQTNPTFGSQPNKVPVAEADIQRFCQQFGSTRDVAICYLEAFGTYTLAANNYMNDNKR